MPNTHVPAAGEAMPAAEKTGFFDLEPLVCDAVNMLDVLLDMMERDFATTGPVDIDRAKLIACSSWSARRHCSQPT
ncbi:hypothetical protein FJ938_20835 [Mesorhizobium sp. B2-4-14]|uniref:hypothetical protein n=1 Tax=Mesorhizobium sp. B2-4-14 TaxID=2589935 RepID=UPI00112C1A22|nr:hypothetical protein [Mesorhizobium sp. B2-4-14]TPL01368.1 hypothetical protein FJ938_20835 [Mesorhizobium sp. B2-4-14]